MNRFIRCYFCFADDSDTLKELTGRFPDARRFQLDDSIVVLRSTDAGTPEELAELLADDAGRDKAGPGITENVIGTSIIILNTDEWDSSSCIGSVKPAWSELSDCHLGFDVTRRNVHHYIIGQLRENIDWEQFLRLFLRFDLQVFKTGYQVFHYQDQANAMIDELKSIDEKVGKLLFKYHSGAKANLECLDIWEKDISELSGVFSGLGSYISVIKKMESSLAIQIDSLYTALKRIKESVPEHDPLVRLTAGWVASRLNRLRGVGEQMAMSRDNAFAAMNVVQAKVNLKRAGDEMVLQGQMGTLLEQNVSLLKEGVALQVSAAFIEFIVVSYYSLSIWKTVAPEAAFHHIPGWLKLLTVLLFAGCSVVSTHFVAEHFLHKEKQATRGLIFSLVALLGIFVFMIVVSLLY